MRIALFAADDFSIQLCRYLAGEHMLACLVTQPDKPRGRGGKVSKLPVRIEAETHNVPVFIPDSLNDENFKTEFKAIGADIPVVAAYGLFIPKWIRDWNPFPCINVHPSILPRWRGADPIRSAVMAGDAKSGVSLHFTKRKIDTGDVIATSTEYDIDANQTFDELKSVVSEIAVMLVRDFLNKLASVNISDEKSTKGHSGENAIRELFNCTTQDDSNATYSHKLDKPMMWINWDKPSRDVHNLIRALSSNPGARTGNQQKPLKILRSELVEEIEPAVPAMPGEITSVSRDSLVVSCSDGLIRLVSLQPSGKRVMDAADFINGYRVKPGTKITNY